VKSNIRNLNIILLNNCKFHGKQHREGHTFLMSATEIPFTYVTASFSALLLTHATPPKFLTWPRHGDVS
jgi:hypothetical protein